ncbi:MAG TPA: LPS export ABC transporter permease LptF [Nevskiaceae bacterium]|nr:LPS export ABC transporter permease LptF [Nevskiaceae bacterium]
MSRVLDRYLLREAARAWFAVTVVLLAVMLATRFARILGEAAKGEVPADLLMTVVALSSLQYLTILVPVSLLLGLMLALGRLYKDSEVAAMMGCGVGQWALFRPLLLLTLLVAGLTALLAFQWSPWAGREADFRVKDARRLIQYTPFEPGRFKELSSAGATFYAAEMDPTGQTLTTIFAHLDEGGGSETLLLASEARQDIDGRTGDRQITLRGGWRLQGVPGEAGWDLMRFEELTTRITPPAFLYVAGKRKLMASTDLRQSTDPQDQAEWAWRVAAPVSVLVLGLLAVPLSHLRPRQGRYSKLVLGIVAYLVYSNLLGVGQNWIAKGSAPAALGLWWVHALFLIPVVVLLARQQGWGRR